MRYTGQVGYVTQTEKDGIWTPVEHSRTVRGDIIRQSASVQNGDKVNSDISLAHRVSFLGDLYAFDNYYNIKWIFVDGRKWSVTSIEIQRPRIIVSLGGLWNG